MKPGFFKVEYKTEAKITPQLVSDLLDCAFAGGSSYWAEIVDRDNAHRDLVMSEVPSAGGFLLIRDTLSENPNGYNEFTLDWKVCVRGMKSLAEIAPHRFKYISTDSFDAADGDAFLQCCLFGRIIYG